MRKTLLAATAALSLLSTGALADTRSLDVEPFDRVDIATGLTAIVTYGETQSLSIEAENGHVLDQIEIRVKNGELRARRNTNLLDIILSGGLLNKALFEDSTTLHITLPAFTGAVASSGARVSAAFANGDTFEASASSGGQIAVDAVDADTISVDVSSGSRVTLSGTCALAELDFSSGAKILAEKLVCGDVDVDGSSGASATIGVEGDVTGKISSGANVRLHGTPDTVKVQSSSGGNLKIEN